jgi:glycosyltransferase involved in cell wall biosynthesis
MKLLVWHWGRRGAGPHFALRLARALATLPQTEAALSLAAGAEILGLGETCDWAEPTYESGLGYLRERVLPGPGRARTAARLAALAPDAAICAMPALLDPRMTKALVARRIPYGVIVHDATAHPGEALRHRLVGQTALLRDARVMFTLTSHVETVLRESGLGGGQTIMRLAHPPWRFGPPAPPPFAHGGPSRLLCFGRLLPYKGIDLLAEAVARFPPPLPFVLRVCGEGPESAPLSALARMPGVSVERGWVAESAIPGLLTWADAVVLPYREASQSGVAAAALAHGRAVIATRVGGLVEQLSGTALARLCAPEPSAIAAAIRATIAERPAGPALDDSSAWVDMASKVRAAFAS